MRYQALACAAALFVLALPLRANAFCRTTTCDATRTSCAVDDQGCPSVGKPVIWKPGLLTFKFQARGSSLLVNEEARAAVRAAFFRWSDVMCPTGRTSLRFIEGEDLVADKPLIENNATATASVSPFGIYFRDRGWPHQQSGGDGVLALTTLVYGAESARVVYADIEINSGGRPLTTSESGTGDDLQTVVTHEVGHYIGLAHSRVANSIMSASLCESGDRCSRDKVSARRLGDDDRAAVCAVFPPEALAVEEPAPEPETCSASLVGPRREGLPLLSTALVSLALVRRIRRKSR